MRRYLTAVCLTALLALAASAMAQPGQQGPRNGRDFDPTKSFGGEVTKVFKDSKGTLLTFVVKGFQGRRHRQGQEGQAPPATITATIKVTSKTEYTKGWEPAKSSVVKVGEHVFVMLSAPLSKNAGTAVRVGVMPKFDPGKMVVGTVAKVSRSSKGNLQSFEVKVTPPPGGPRGGSSDNKPAPFTAKITVNSSTKYTNKEAKPTSSSGLKTGVRVLVMLTAPLKNKAGTAETVGIGFEGFGRGGPGGPGGGRGGRGGGPGGGPR